MPTIIEVQFLTGRYHAHIWGEAQFAMGEPEWPPSTWRLLRALAAAWFSTRPSSDDARDELLEALGRCDCPELWLPRVAFDELRFFQPLDTGTRKLHHDFFAELERCYFVFHTELRDEQTRLLRCLLRQLRYFGRAESRAMFHLLDDATTLPLGYLRIRSRLQAVGEGSALMRRHALCPNPEDFRASDLWKIRDVRTSDPFPMQLVDALIKARKPLPDGSVWVEYVMPEASVLQVLPRRVQRNALPQMVQVSSIEFRLFRRTPIHITDAVRVARAFRDAVTSTYTRMTGERPTLTLSGRDNNGIIDNDHQHLYYLPQPDQSGRRIDRLIINVPAGELRRDELDALLCVERISLSRDGRYPITVIQELQTADAPRVARIWTASTPFVPPLHHRLTRTASAPDAQLASCIIKQTGIAPSQIYERAGPNGRSIMTLIVHEYPTRRQRQDDAGPWRLTRRYGRWFKIEFDTDVHMLPMGADAHFGLGQFVPAAYD